MLSELKPCPFCGGSSISVYPRTCDRSTPYNAADRAFPVVRCRTCGADAQGEDWGAPTTAVEKWNRRAAIEKDGAQGVWRNAETDGLPPCDGETVFIGINTNGFAACFNEIAPHGACSMRGPELSTCQMSGLEWWRELDRPPAAPGAATPEPTNANRLHNEVLRLQVNEHSLLTHQQASRYLLQRATKQLERWAEKYGAWQPEWLPPAGDVTLAEDIAEHLGSATPEPRAVSSRDREVLTEIKVRLDEIDLSREWRGEAYAVLSRLASTPAAFVDETGQLYDEQANPIASPEPEVVVVTMLSREEMRVACVQKETIAMADDDVIQRLFLAKANAALSAAGKAVRLEITP